MASPVTLRLSEETRRRIQRIAQRKRISASEVIREAIEAWVEEQEPVTTPFEAMTDLLGVVRGGDAKRSTQTGRRFRERLKGLRSVR